MTRTALLTLPALALALAACATDEAAYEPAPFEAETTAAPTSQEAQAAYEALARLGTDEAAIEAMVEPMTDSMLPLFEPMFAEAGVTDPAQKRVFASLFAAELVEAMEPRLFDLTLAVIQDRIGASEAVETARFFETPAGRSYADALPDLMRAGAEAGQAMGVELAPSVIQEVADELASGRTAMEPEAAAKIAEMLRQAPTQ